MHSKRAAAMPESGLVVNLHRTVDAGLLAILFLAPLAMAGRFAAGRLLLISLVGVTSIAWAAARYFSRRPQAWTVTGAEWIAVLALGLVVTQVTPMSTSVLQTLSPTISELLPLHHGVTPSVVPDATSSETTNSVGTIVGWRSLSLAPHETRGGLAMLVAYVLLFGVVSQRVQRRQDVEKMLKCVALAGVSMACIALLQRVMGNGKFLWFMEHPSRDTLLVAKGTFANENHFAHFLALTLGPLLWWVVTEHGDTEKSRQRHSFSTRNTRVTAPRIPRGQIVPLVGLCIVALAALFTFSRGGLAMMALSAAVTLGLFASQRRVGPQAMLGLTAAIAVAVLCVWVQNSELLMRELETLQTTSIESLDQGQGRRKIWSAVTAAVPDFALLGTGVGSHRYVYPTYLRDAASVQYTHAESGYLQVLLETGGLGFVLLLCGIGLSASWIVRVLERGERGEVLLAVPLAASWVVSVVHGVFDFNWFIPANLCVTLLLLATAARLLTLNRGVAVPVRVDIPKRVNWAAITAGIVVVVIFSAKFYVGPARGDDSFQEYKAWSLAANRFAAKSTGPGRQRSLGFVDPSLPETTQRMIRLLDETLQRDPQHGRAHVRMAALCLRQFDQLQKTSSTGMDLAHIRDAALQAEFASHQQMVDWVMRVAGDNAVYLQRVLWHARKGIQLTPTEGQGYLYLSEVAFLDPRLRGREHELLFQAYKVRPYDPSIQFVHGRHRLLAGHQDEALALWKDAFRRSGRVRKQVIEAVAGRVSAEEIVEVMQPDRRGFRDLFDHYRLQNLQEPMRAVGYRYVQTIEEEAKQLSGDKAGQLWFDAQFVHATLGNREAALEAAKNSVLTQPREYRNHFALALRLRDDEQLEEAIEEFKWCQQRQPENGKLVDVIKELRAAVTQQTIAQDPLRMSYRSTTVGNSSWSVE